MLADNKFKQSVSTKPSNQTEATQGKSEFVLTIAREGIKYSNTWMERCKILEKNFERALANTTTKLNLYFIKPMIERIPSSF
jgi:hypothetical protein